MPHIIICAIQALQKGYYVRSSSNVSTFPSKNSKRSNFSIRKKIKIKKRCLMISVVIVTQVLGLLDQDSVFQVGNIFHWMVRQAYDVAVLQFLLPT